MGLLESYKDTEIRNSRIKISKIKITDASALRHSGIFKLSVSECEKKVRSLVTLMENNLLYTWIVIDKEINLPKAIIYLDMKNNRNALIDIEAGENELSFDEIYKVIDQVLYKCFFKLDLHKISVKICPDSLIDESILMELGFVQEAVLHSEFKIGNEYVDGGLFYLTAPMYKGYNVGFVPYRRGLLIIYGTNTYVDRIGFARYGEEASTGFVREAAYYMGIIDEENKYLPMSSAEYDYDVEDIDFLPLEIQRCFSELKEYFIKHRENFDINVVFPSGTDFQLKVWNSLKNIPYGVTWSYYDLALEITGDKEKAKKLTRAVGSACSENPVPLIVPCHRVIGKDGKLVGFAGGVDIKDFLLQLETFPFMMI